jgi:hypothetical protein
VGNMFSVMPVILARMCMEGNTFSVLPMIIVFMQGKALAAGHYTCQPRVGCSLNLAHLFVIKLLECTQLVNRSGPLTYLAFVIDWCESSECVPFEEYHS